MISCAAVLYRGIVSNRPPFELDPLFTALYEETRAHFTAEEGLMLASGYPRYEEHVAEHKRLLDQLAILRGHLAIGEGATSSSLATLIRVWSEQHIVFSDRDFAAYLNRQGFPSNGA